MYLFAAVLSCHAVTWMIVPAGRIGATSSAYGYVQQTLPDATIAYAARAHAGWSATDSYHRDDKQARRAISRSFVA